MVDDKVVVLRSREAEAEAEEEEDDDSEAAVECNAVDEIVAEGLFAAEGIVIVAVVANEES